MRAELAEDLESALGARVVGDRACGGGSIHDARLVDLADGRRVFVKASAVAVAAVFAREARGLEALAEVGALRVPQVLAVGAEEGHGMAFLVLEAIEIGTAGAGFAAAFGHRFAELHRGGRGTRFGFEEDNELGATSQPNGWADDWVEFWRRNRLGHQLRLARTNGRSDGELERLGERLLDRLDTWLVEPAEPPTLLHGDLWGGNYLVDAAGDPVLIDPAVYYGRREADLAMTYLFGGFDTDFYRAYDETWPLAPGSAERLEIYKLYHLLNHLNLFGTSYLAPCLAILRRLVGG